MPEVHERQRPSLTEPLAAWATAIVVAAGLFWLGRVADFVQRIMQGVIACMFLVGPHLATRISGRPFDERAAGMHLGSVGRGARTLGLAVAGSRVESWVNGATVANGVGRGSLGNVLERMSRQSQAALRSKNE